MCLSDSLLYLSGLCMRETETRADSTLTSSSSSSCLTDDAVPGSTEIPARPKKEVSLRGADAPSAGSVLRRGSPPAALHHRDENEEHVTAWKEQGRRRRRRRRVHLCSGSRVRGNSHSSTRAEGLLKRRKYETLEAQLFKRTLSLWDVHVIYTFRGSRSQKADAFGMLLMLMLFISFSHFCPKQKRHP